MTQFSVVRIGLMAAAALCVQSAQAVVCVVPDAGGTAQLPPSCTSGYQSPEDVHLIIDGLPPGTTIIVDASHERFNVTSSGAGGTLGGEFEQFGSHVIMSLNGTGALAGFSRFIDLPAACETHIGPRTPGEPVQSFDTTMFAMQGQITGDPDFDLLRITAGDSLGLPSPGHTTLFQRQGGGGWVVDSYFDITYRIDFIGAPGSPLAGMSGSTTATIRMGTGSDQACCLPAQCAEMPFADCCVQGGIPQGRGSDCAEPGIICGGSANDPRACCLGGNDCIDTSPTACCALGGEPGQVGSTCGAGACAAPMYCFPCCLPNGTCQFSVAGGCAQMGGVITFGVCGGCSGSGGICPQLQACCFPATGSCQNLTPTQCQAQGGNPVNGETCATISCPPPAVCGPGPAPNGCSYTACPGSQVCTPKCARIDPYGGTVTVTDCDCMSSSSCHAVPYAGPPPHRGAGNTCVVPDNGGTVSLPPAGCEYLSPEEVHLIVDGLDAGTTIELAPIHKDFICNGPAGGTQGLCSFIPPPGFCEQPGGTMAGHQDCAVSTLELELNGTGGLAGYNRSLTIFPLEFEVHTGPRIPGEPVQEFDTQMMRVQGQITGDPDFDLLRVTGGTDFGMPSPGHTTLTQLPGGEWAVDSFFDITYRIDFIGSPTASRPELQGRSGSTTATIRMRTGAGVNCVGACPPNTVCNRTTSVDQFGQVTVCCSCSIINTGACCSTSGTCTETRPEDCHGFTCDTADFCPAPWSGCFADADCNGVVNAGDRGVISANIGQTAADLVCRFDLDGNGVINPGDRGIVSANIGSCTARPDWQSGGGCNHGVCPDPRFPQPTFHGEGTTCANTTCP